MNCVKCGKKTEDTNVFCAECLEGMKQYPVKPGTKVHIPVRAANTERRPQIRKERTPEEQITSLHKLVQVLVIMVACLLTTLTVTVGMLVYALADDIGTETQQQAPVGRNYTITAPADED